MIDNFVEKMIQAPCPSRAWSHPETYLDSLMSNEWYHLVFKLQSEIIKQTHDFYQRKHIVPSLWPVTTGSISSPMGLGSDSLPVEVSIQNQKTFLADSQQFMLELGLRFAPEGNYYIMPSFRGEAADARHLCEFFHSEVEIVGSLDDIMRLAEAYIRSLTQHILDTLGDDFAMWQLPMEHMRQLLQSEIPKVSYTQALSILQIKTEHGIDSPECYVLTPSDEQRLMRHFNGFVWVTHIPKVLTPFYQATDQQSCTLSADLLMGIGETIGAGERHSEVGSLLQSMLEHQVHPSDYKWYIEMKKRRPMKTSGFGMGMERFMLWLLQHDDIRDCQLLPRFNGGRFSP